MADLPLIPNPSPVTTPAIPEVEYNESYIVKFSLSTTDAAGFVQPIRVTFRPYAYSSKTLYPDDSRDVTHTFDNVWMLAYQHPLAAQVIGGLVQVFSLELQLRLADGAIVSAQAAEDVASGRLAEIATMLETETDPMLIESLGAEQIQREAALSSATDALAEQAIIRDAILAGLGV